MKDTLQFLRYYILSVNERNDSKTELDNAFNIYNNRLLELNDKEVIFDSSGAALERENITNKYKERVDYERQKRVFAAYDKLILGA